MAKFYTLKTTAGALRYFITKSEAVVALDIARASASAGGARVLKNGASISAARVLAGKNRLDVDGEVDEVDIDEVDVRSMAAQWLNASEIKRAAAIKREAAKTQAQATAIAKKVWAKRRENGTDKRKK